MNEVIVEVKLELEISGSGDLNVKVKSIGGSMRKGVKQGAYAASRSNSSASFASTDGSYTYQEIPLSLSIVGLPLTDDVASDPGRETSGTEVLENPNG